MSNKRKLLLQGDLLGDGKPIKLTSLTQENRHWRTELAQIIKTQAQNNKMAGADNNI
ncbi:MAG: hypothetical protein GY922_15475 [Proteobacteria bacterium]|jgi:hypothetical protein|nr:hypothetical protein [Pseudomonadota bacterium]